MALIDLTLSNARRFYLLMGNPLEVKGLTREDIFFLNNFLVVIYKWDGYLVLLLVTTNGTTTTTQHYRCPHHFVKITIIHLHDYNKLAIAKLVN